MRIIDRNNVGVIFLPSRWKRYRKRTETFAVRVEGSFEVKTREGTLSCPDGYLALDSQGWPYPIAKGEFETIYKEVT